MKPELTQTWSYEACMRTHTAWETRESTVLAREGGNDTGHSTSWIYFIIYSSFQPAK